MCAVMLEREARCRMRSTFQRNGLLTLTIYEHGLLKHIFVVGMRSNIVEQEPKQQKEMQVCHMRTNLSCHLGQAFARTGVRFLIGGSMKCFCFLCGYTLFSKVSGT